MSGSDSEQLAKQFVDSWGNVSWYGVARTMVSSLVLATGAGIIWFWEAVVAQPRRFIVGVFDYWRTLLMRPFQHGADQFWTAWDVAAASLPELGPFTWLVTVALIAFVFWLAFDVGWKAVKGVFK